jgi:aryl-alcohol dehydrogenase-like predicted oxidoreductase
MISAVKSVSEQTGRSMAQVALAWLHHQTVPVIHPGVILATFRQRPELAAATLLPTATTCSNIET